MKLASILVSLLFFFSCQQKKNLVVNIETELGSILIELYSDKAPVTVKKFLRLVDDGVYENSSFYRVVRLDNQPENPIKIEVIQGGLRDDQLIEMHEPIVHETTDETGIKHLDGTFSMARLEPGTASTEFFICVGDQPDLDYGGKRNPEGQGFSAFGRVIEGMNVVRKIQAGAATAQTLDKSLIIKYIKRN
ncbi:peptidylprolyl isomerase [uncultured Sunxiuqinia sp.]|uniref:peptidylprolyl isomerase n=1 Tax=uncultured Sunxiuqinia sp. TaxID=1573825 RepID=UPI002AA8A63C|nr:peptidylprolyl isomerase [uncultured Sunxiuqinia sp.]